MTSEPLPVADPTPTCSCEPEINGGCEARRGSTPELCSAVTDSTPTPLTDAEPLEHVLARADGAVQGYDGDWSHLAAAVEASDWLSAREAAARADERERALLEAAIDWRDGEWRPVLHNDAGDNLTVAGRVTKWLRTRAALTTGGAK